MIKPIMVLLVAVFSAPAAPASAPSMQPMPPARLTDVLSDDEVKLALSGKGKDHDVLIQNMDFWQPQGQQKPKITLFMPEALLAIQAELAKKQFTKYEPSEEDKRRSLMIVAEGYAGDTIAQGCTSITRVVLLSDATGEVVKEAYLSEPLDETWRNSFGATNECQALRTKFLLTDVYEVRAAAPNGEFLVAVFSGTVNTKMYKIKERHQSKLALATSPVAAQPTAPAPESPSPLTPASAQVAKPTVDRGVTDSETSTEWVVLKTWSGSGIKETESFSVSSKEWRISWRSRNEPFPGVGYFSIYVKDAAEKLVSVAANKQGVGEDVSYVHSSPGEYHLTINSSNVDWIVRVEVSPRQ